MYKCVYVPAAGCIFPAAYRNRVGPLPTHSASAGGGVGARGEQLLRGFRLIAGSRRSALSDDRELIEGIKLCSFPLLN
jgi:hypothetical protein